MRHELMDILACPICKGQLELTIEQKQEAEIINGTLRCEACKEEYPIKDSIPNLLPPNLR